MGYHEDADEVAQIFLPIMHLGSSHHSHELSRQMYMRIYLVLLRILSPYERELSETQRQLGMLRKGLLVLAINWTLCPIVTNLAIE